MSLLFVALIAVASTMALFIGSKHDVDINVEEENDESMIDFLGV